MGNGKENLGNQTLSCVFAIDLICLYLSVSVLVKQFETRNMWFSVLLSMENKWLDNIDRKLAEPPRASVDAEEISEELDVSALCVKSLGRSALKNCEPLQPVGVGVSQPIAVRMVTPPLWVQPWVFITPECGYDTGESCWWTNFGCCQPFFRPNAAVGLTALSSHARVPSHPFGPEPLWASDLPSGPHLT